MNDPHVKSGTVFSRAWEIISQDNSISPEEKKAILKLIQVLVEARERATDQPTSDEDAKSITQEVISKHSLMATVKHQADELDALKRCLLYTSTLPVFHIRVHIQGKAVTGDTMHIHFDADGGDLGRFLFIFRFAVYTA